MSFLTRWTLSCSPIIAWIFFWFVMLPLFSILHNSSVDVCLSVFGFQGTGCRSLCSDHFLWKRSSGDGEIRTHDPLLARQVLSQLSYTPKDWDEPLFRFSLWCYFVNNSSSIELLYIKMSGSHLLSHAVARIVPSAVKVLTVVFGMGTGVSPSRIATGQFYHCDLSISLTIK